MKTEWWGGGRTLDGGWASIFNEENEEDLVRPRSGRALEAEAVACTKARLWCRNTPTDGRDSRAAGGSTVNKVKEQDEAYGQ